MHICDRMAKLRLIVMEKIEKAAKKNETDSILLYSKILEDIKGMEKTVSEFLDRIEHRINAPLHRDSIFIDPLKFLPQKNEKISAKRRGNIRRANVINKIQSRGINLTQVKGRAYRTDNGSLVGIASASEDLKKGKYWFLGLPGSNDYDTVILLCEDSKGEVLSFIFSKDFYKQIEDKLSRDQKGEMKFIIVQRGGKYQIIIPQMDPVIIEEYLNNFNGLREL